MKYFMKHMGLSLVVLFPIIFSIASCTPTQKEGGNINSANSAYNVETAKQSSNGKSSNGKTTSQQTKAKGKQDIIDYLDQNGTGSYHFVETANDEDIGVADLGYKDDKFYLGLINTYKTWRYNYMASFSYGATNGFGLFSIINTSANMTLFQSTETLVMDNDHTIDTVTDVEVQTNKLGSDDDTIESIAKIMTGMSIFAIASCNSFLVEHDLPYIF